MRMKQPSIPNAPANSPPNVTTAQGIAPPPIGPDDLDATRRVEPATLANLADTYAELGETRPGGALDERDEETLTRDVGAMLAQARPPESSTNPLIRAPMMTFPKAATELARRDAPTAPGVDDTSPMPASSDDDDPSMLGPAIVNPRHAQTVKTTTPPLNTTQPMAVPPLKATQPIATQHVSRPPTPPPLPVERPVERAVPPALPPPERVAPSALGATTTAVMPVSVPPAAYAPVLVDVTPRALVVETAGGYSDIIVPRNAKIPCERTRAFSPARDHQRLVRIRVAQGEDPVFTGNTYLGELELTELRDGVRSDISIAVTFSVDASGTVQVSATDVATGRAARASLQLIGVAEETSIQRMRARTEQARVS
jgi:molecular chaperone DnaK